MCLDDCHGQVLHTVSIRLDAVRLLGEHNLGFPVVYPVHPAIVDHVVLGVPRADDLKGLRLKIAGLDIPKVAFSAVFILIFSELEPRCPTARHESAQLAASAHGVLQG